MYHIFQAVTMQLTFLKNAPAFSKKVNNILNLTYYLQYIHCKLSCV